MTGVQRGKTAELRNTVLRADGDLLSDPRISGGVSGPSAMTAQAVSAGPKIGTPLTNSLPPNSEAQECLKRS